MRALCADGMTRQQRQHTDAYLEAGMDQSGDCHDDERVKCVHNCLVFERILDYLYHKRICKRKNLAMK